MSHGHTAISHDGAAIAYDREGNGPPIVLVGGAFQFRAFDPATKRLATLLADRGYTAINYDRRGRGESAHDGAMDLHHNLADLRAIATELDRTHDLGEGVAL